MINSSFLDGLKTPGEAIEKVLSICQNKLGKKINFRLKDWGISRQIIGDVYSDCVHKNGNIVKVPKEMLPIKLPEKINLNTKEIL